jgi:hypothetical protein
VMERIGGEVRSVVSGLGPSGAMPEVLAAWPGTVGEEIARNAWPARIARDGTLHVSVLSSTWAFELSQFSTEIASRLQQALREDAPRALRFTPGPLPERPPEGGKTVKEERRKPSPAEREQAERLTSEIGDEDLRKLVAKAAAESLAKAAADRSVC